MVAPSIYIPVQNSQEKVQVFLDQLPNHNDLLDLLKAEQAPLDIWLSLAREYFKQGNVNAFLEILEEGSCPEVDEFYSEVKYERIAILNALAAYYTNLGKTRKRQRDEYFIKAVDFYNRAAKIDTEELTTFVGKGQLQLAKGDWDNAAQMFNIVLEEKPDYLLAHLGQACALFNKGRFGEALRSYKKILEINPACPAYVRLGIGLCHYRLQFLNVKRAEFHATKARCAFERVLEMEPDNVEGQVYLSLMDINSENELTVSQAVKRLREAYQTYPYNPLALNHLANHFFFSGEIQFVEPLLEAALSATGNPLLHAECNYNLGRYYHFKEDWDKAYFFYQRSTQDLPPKSDFILPWFGLAQVYFLREDYDRSLNCLETVVEIDQKNGEAFKLLGIIHKKKGSRKEALANLEKVIRLDQNDEQAWMEISELYVTFDINKALDALKKAHELLRLKNKPMSTEFLNNLGTVYFLQESYKEAKRFFIKALGEQTSPWWDLIKGPVESLASFKGIDDLAVEEPEERKIPHDKISTFFNLARTFEQLRESGRAVVMYLAILRWYPEYVDAYLRLAAVAQSQSDWERSLQWLSKALSLDPKNPDALLLKSAVEMKQGNTAQSRLTLKHCLEVHPQDPPPAADLSLGFWNLEVSYLQHKTYDEEKAFLLKAREYFLKVLAQNKNNYFAALGLACVLAEEGDFDAAKEIFVQARDYTSVIWNANDAEIWVNLAHIHLAREEYSTAITLYKNCILRRHYGPDGEVLLYLARAQYEAKVFPDATRTVTKALRLFPDNNNLWFNVALCLQKYATEHVKEDPTVKQVHEAINSVHSALRIFVQLSKSNKFDQRKCEVHIQYCKSNLFRYLQKKEEEAVKREEEKKKKEQFMKQKILAEEARERAELEKKMEEERREKEERERRAAEIAAELEKQKAMWRREREAEEEETRRKSERKRKKGKKDAMDDFINDREEYEQPEELQGHGKRGFQGKESSPLADDNENGKLEDNVLEDEDFESKATTAEKGKRRRSRAIIESEDEEENDEANVGVDKALKNAGLDSDSD